MDESPGYQLLEALDALEAMVHQHCENDAGVIGSRDNEANADAMRLLDEHGRLKLIAVAVGTPIQLVIGKWIEEEERR